MLTKRMARLAGHAAVAVAAVLALSACDVMVGVGGFGGKETAKDEWKKSYPLAATGQVEMVNVNGSIQIEATDGASVDIVAVREARAATPEAARDLLQRIEIREEASPDRVRIEVRPPSGFGVQTSVQFVVKLPRAAAVKLSSTNGKINVLGVQGHLGAETTNGSVTGRGLGGGVEASTTNGSVTIEVDALAADGIRLETTNGSVQLTLPKTSKADVRARCVNGSVNTSFLDIQLAGEQSRRRLDGRLNGGGSRVEIETTNGGIRIMGK